MKILNFSEAEEQLYMKTIYALVQSPIQWGLRLLQFGVQHISKITMQFQFQLRKNNTLVLDPYFNSLCPWLVRPDRSKTTAVAQSTWMPLKSQTTDSEDVQDQKHCFAQPSRSLFLEKSQQNPPGDHHHLPWKIPQEFSFFTFTQQSFWASHSKASGLHKAVLQREVFGKLDTDVIVRHETLNLEEIYSWKASLKCTNNTLVSSTQAHWTIPWMCCVPKDTGVVLTQSSFSKNTILPRDHSLANICQAP